MTDSENIRRMRAGLVYDATDPALTSDQTARMELLYDFNATRPGEHDRRHDLLNRMFESIGRDCHIEPPVHANWAGREVTMGDRVYANFGLTLVDDAAIRIDDDVMIGPNVTITTAGHPVNGAWRRRGAQFNRPVHIERGVWLGAGVIVLPGVVIGENSVVGAGSVVTRSIPADVVAVGAPCRVIRPIGGRDRIFYWRDERMDEGFTTARDA